MIYCMLVGLLGDVLGGVSVGDVPGCESGDVLGCDAPEVVVVGVTSDDLMVMIWVGMWWMLMCLVG